MSISSFIRHALYEADQFLARYEYKEKTRERVSATIDPNQNSAVKTEIYSWGLSRKIVWGEPCDIEITNQPDTSFRVCSWKSNAPAPGVVIVKYIMVANIGCHFGDSTDAYGEQQGDWPTLDPSNSLRIYAKYTGYIPPGYVKGTSFDVTFTLTGHATIVGGGYSSIHWDPHPADPAWRRMAEQEVKEEEGKNGVTSPQEPPINSQS